MYAILVNNISGSRASTIFKITGLATHTVKNYFRGHLKTN